MSDGEQSLVNLGVFLWNGKWLIAAVLIACVGVTLALSFLVEPVYRAEGTYQYVAEQDGNVGAGVAGGAFGALAASFGAGLPSGSDNVQSAIVTLNSRQFMIQFAREQNLAPLLFEKRWSSQEQNWISPETKPSDWDIAEELGRRVSASLDAKTGLVVISFRWEDPAMAVELLSHYVKQANVEFRREADERTSARLEYLTAALEATNFGEVKSSISELIKTEVERKMMISLEADYALRSVSDPVLPDDDAYVSPNRGVLLATAIVFGFFIGLTASYVRELSRRNRGVSGDAVA